MLGLQRSLVTFPRRNLPAHSRAGSTSAARVSSEEPRIMSMSTVAPWSCAAIPGETPGRGISLNLALWGMKSVKHNFPMHLLISKHFAWIIAQISLGSRISGTDKEISFVRSTKCCLHSSTEKVFRKFCSILCCLAQRRASKPGAQNVNIGVI